MLDAEATGEEMPDFRKTFLSASAAAAMAGMTLPASAQTLAPWFKDSVGMSEEDMTKMKVALKEAVDQKKVGATAD